MANLENLTIMFTDIVGYSDLVSKLSREENQAFLDKHDRILGKIIKQFAGKTIKTIGDSFLVSFRSPTDAVLCGMAMQDALWEVNKTGDVKNPIVIRVALNAGEVRQTQNDVFGDAVNIAARLESITPANAVYLTEAVYLSMNKSEACLEPVDAFKFKGAREKVNVYQAAYRIPEQETAESSFVTDEASYPYGGVHIHHRARHKPLGSTAKIIISSIVLLLIISSTWWITRNYSSQGPGAAPEKVPVEYAEVLANKTNGNQNNAPETDFQQQAEPLLTAGNYDALDSLLKQVKTENAEGNLDDGYINRLSAHTHMYFMRYEDALMDYETAFESNKSLSNDPLTVENLMILLERKRTDASKLIAKNLNSLIILKLGERTGKSGLTGRYDAFNLLKDSSHEEVIDRVGLNIWDLRELKKCSLKKVAVIELKRLKDVRALDALKEVTKVGLIGRIKYGCLRKDAKEAIALIEASL